MNHIGVLHRKIPKFRVLQRTNLSSRRWIKFILYFYFFFSRLARSKSLSSSFPNLRNSISRESWCGGRLYLESRSLETARTARRPHKNGRCVPRRLNKSNECRKHDEYASETCMDSARVNGPSPLPRHVRRVYPTGGRFPQNSSHVKRVLVERFFSSSHPQELHLDPVIPPGFVVGCESRVRRETCRSLTHTLKRYIELSRIKFIYKLFRVGRKRRSRFIRLLDRCLPDQW